MTREQIEAWFAALPEDPRPVGEVIDDAMRQQQERLAPSVGGVTSRETRDE